MTKVFGMQTDRVLPINDELLPGRGDAWHTIVAYINSHVGKNGDMPPDFSG